MKKNKKILWKIEELWNKYYIANNQENIDISQIHLNYSTNESVYHSRFCSTQNFNFTQSQENIFSDDYGEYKGLKKCQLSVQDSKPIYLFDNHNEMIYPLVEIFNATQTRYGVVHIDAHPDDAEFQGTKVNDVNLKNTKEYIAKTRVSDFFDALSETNIIGTIDRITHSDSLEFFLPPEQPYVLSLDIDIFGPEGDFAELPDKVRAIALAWNSADAICIAMSPGFIDYDFAQAIIEIMIGDNH